MEKKRLMRKCASCLEIYPVRRDSDPYTEHPFRGNPFGEKIFLSWREDPFAADIYDDHTLMWLCDICEYENAMDI